MTFSRRQTLIGTAAMVAAAALPTIAPSTVEFPDPTVERMKTMLGQLTDLLKSHGYATAKLADGGSILVWLDDRNDMTSMAMMSLEDDATPDVIDVLDRIASIEPTLVRL